MRSVTMMVPMRIPQLLQVFIPFSILDRALDDSRSMPERLLYGGMFGTFILAAISVALGSFSAGVALSDIIKLVIMCIYTCVLVYAMIVGGRTIFRMGKSAQGLSKVGYHTLGVLCIFCGILLIIVAPYAPYFNYS